MSPIKLDEMLIHQKAIVMIMAIVRDKTTTLNQFLLKTKSIYELSNFAIKPTKIFRSK